MPIVYACLFASTFSPTEQDFCIVHKPQRTRVAHIFTHKIISHRIYLYKSIKSQLSYLISNTSLCMRGGWGKRGFTTKKKNKEQNNQASNCIQIVLGLKDEWKVYLLKSNRKQLHGIRHRRETYNFFPLCNLLWRKMLSFLRRFQYSQLSGSRSCKFVTGPSFIWYNLWQTTVITYEEHQTPNITYSTLLNNNLQIIMVLRYIVHLLGNKFPFS